MGLLKDIAASIGGEDLNRLAAGKANLEDPNSPDQQSLLEMLKNITPDKLKEIFATTAQKIAPQMYSEHVTPGVGGTNPLGNLAAGGLATTASILVNCLKNLGADSGSNGSPLDKVPGLQTTDPKNMDAADVATVARYTQENHPNAFGQAAAQIAQKEPALLHSFLGKAALALGAAALASHFIKLDRG